MQQIAPSSPHHHLWRVKSLIIVGCWLLVFGLALLVDVPVATFMHDRGYPEWIKSHPAAHEWLRMPGLFWYTSAAAITILVWTWFLLERRKGLFWARAAIVFLSGCYA